MVFITDPTNATLLFEDRMTMQYQVQALKEGAYLAAGIDDENYQVDIRPVADNIRRSLLANLD